MDCYGCDKEIKPGDEYKRMRVEYERQKQPFCKECAERLMKIKLGFM